MAGSETDAKVAMAGSLFFEREYALRAHDRDDRGKDRMLDSALEFSAIAVRTTVLITGGSVVVGLGFVGSIFGSDPVTAKKILGVVFIFAIGVILGGMSTGFTYLAQARYTESSRATQHVFEHPYVLATPEQKIFKKKGAFWSGASILSVVASYISIIVGVGYAWLIL